MSSIQVREPVGRATGPTDRYPGRPRRRLPVTPVVDGIAVAAGVVALGATWRSALYGLVVLVVLGASGAQRTKICLRLADDLPALAIAVLVPAVLAPPTALVCFAALVAGRALAYPAVRAARRRGWGTERTLIVGTGALGRELAALAAERAELGLRPIGFLDHLPPGEDSPLPLLGAPEQLAATAHRYEVRRVIICFPALDDATLVGVLRAARPLRAHVSVVPRLFELGTRVPARYRDEVWGVPVVTLRRAEIGPVGQVVKRGFDVVAAALLLVLTAPLLGILVAGLAVRHGWPVLFRQQRISGDRMVRLAKLRTMSAAAPDTNWAGSEPGSTLRRALRASHLDELPQLVAVLRGDMSLVGPRPERPYFADQFAATIPRYADRHRARAGLTGWAQVNGLHGDSSMAQRIRFDNEYLEHWSPWTDLVILARTAATPLVGLWRAMGGIR